MLHIHDYSLFFQDLAENKKTVVSLHNFGFTNSLFYTNISVWYMYESLHRAGLGVGTGLRPNTADAGSPHLLYFFIVQVAHLLNNIGSIVKNCSEENIRVMKHS